MEIIIPVAPHHAVVVQVETAVPAPPADDYNKIVEKKT